MNKEIVAKALCRIAKELIGSSIKYNKGDYYVDGVKAVDSSLIRERKRSKRVCWKGRPWEIPMVVWKVGAVLNNGDKWTVELLLENKRKVMVTLDEFLKIN